MDRNTILNAMGITQWVLRGQPEKQPPKKEAPLEEARAAIAKAHPERKQTEHRQPEKRQAEESVPEKASAPEKQIIPIQALTLESLRGEVSRCTACSLAQSRTHTVFGEGPNQADWLFVGEAPGQQEDRQGRPFVGRAGTLLTQMVLALDKKREQVFIANALKCRPPNNRDPLPVELAACEHFLLNQIELTRPKVMVALGRISAQALLKTDQPLGRLRGQVYHYGPDRIPLIVTYHPAYLLRQPADKGKVWADLLLAHRQIPV